MNEPVPLTAAISKFVSLYGNDDNIIKAYAPGRVNLIGEHTDYNDGFVLPFALPFRTVVVGSSINNDKNESEIYSVSLKNDDGKSSSNDDEFKHKFQIHNMNKISNTHWTNYIKGTIAQYINFLPKDFAIQLVIASDVPMGSGLSSSASLEIAIATFIEQILINENISFTPNDGVSKALRCQKAEHEWCDTPCGIMDQYISSMGVENHLLLIDCRSQQATKVAFGGGGGTNDTASPLVLIANSNVKHSLSGSEYPERVQQCKDCVNAIKQIYPDQNIIALRDCNMEMLDTARLQCNLDDITYNRGKHGITEDIRTLAAVESLKNGDWVEVGKYMNGSHDSLKDDFQVSCPELDILVECARQVDGVYGSRMTGGGFGGCTVTLVKPDCVEKLKSHLIKEYKEKTGIDCEVYVSSPSQGAGIF